MFFCSSVEKNSQTKTATPTETPPQNTPFLALLQRNAKAEYANYNNINTLHFCILQFTFVLHPLVFLRSILLLICLTCYNIAYVDGICRVRKIQFRVWNEFLNQLLGGFTHWPLAHFSSHIYIPDSVIGRLSKYQEPPYNCFPYTSFINIHPQNCCDLL